MALAGFGGALPRKLSGCMRQRLGVACALVTNPDVLLMDEAFSALDVLTGESLRNDIRELWESGRIPTKGGDGAFDETLTYIGSKTAFPARAVPNRLPGVTSSTSLVAFRHRLELSVE